MINRENLNFIQFKGNQQKLKKLKNDLYLAKNRKLNLEKKLQQLERKKDIHSNELEKTLTQINEQDKLIFQINAEIQKTKILSGNIPTFPPINFLGLLNQMQADFPFLLFPVRLETRISKNKKKLRIRIIPDKIGIFTHEDLLTEKEETDGKDYWDAIRSDESEENNKIEWSKLAKKYGQYRAAWILSETEFAKDDEEEDKNYRPDAWTKPAVAKILPDFWVVLYETSSGKLETIKTVPCPNDELNVGVDPYADTSNGEESWLADFAKAEENGMGITIAWKPEYGKRLIVVGACVGTNETSKIADLINNFHYSEGFSFLKQGTPTNNTEYATSGFSSEEASNDKSFKIECVEIDDAYNPEENAQRLAKALGIDPSVFDHIENASDTEETEAKAMAQALWPATLGYYFQEIVHLDKIQKGAHKEIKSFITNYIRGRGPLPAIRVSDMPYGILPVISFKRYTENIDERDKFRSGLSRLLLKMFEHYEELSDQVAHIGDSDDPENELIEILSKQASSEGYNIRNVQALEFLTKFYSLKVKEQKITGISSQYNEEVENNLPDININKQNLLKNMLATVCDSDVEALQRPLIVPIENDKWNSDPNEYLSENLTLNESYNYILYLKDKLGGILNSEKPIEEPIADYFDDDKLDSKTEPLLCLLLKHSIIVAYLNWIKNFLIENRIADKIQAREKIFILDKSDIAWEHFEINVPIAILNDNLKDQVILSLAEKIRTSFANTDLDYRSAFVGNLLRQFDITTKSINNINKNLNLQSMNFFGSKNAINNISDLIGSDVKAGQIKVKNLVKFADIQRDYLLQDLRNLKNSLEKLENLSTANLKRLLTETLDVCSYRLDAWITALATEKLFYLQRKPKNGIYLGCYGWLEDLTPSNGKNKENGGFIHAPSINHANAAAVLRNAYMTHTNSKNQEPFAVDLSSERVKRSLWILDGIRQGQPLGALLGYRFERRLHEVSLEKPDIRLKQYIDDFREAFPLNEKDKDQSTKPRNVVDGLALLEEYQTFKEEKNINGFWEKLNLDSDADKPAIVDVLDYLDEILDGLGDLGLAESIYQSVQGKFSRAGAILDAISRGKNPPEPEVIKTPRSGIRFTQKVILNLPQFNPQMNRVEFENLKWKPDTPRALASPDLNYFVCKALGNANNIKCTVSIAGKDEEITAGDLSISPLDFLCLLKTNEKSEVSELERRIEFLIRKNTGNFDADEKVKINFKRQADWKPEDKTFLEICQLADAINQMIAKSRPLDIRDFVLPEELIPNEQLDEEYEKKLGLSTDEVEIGLTSATLRKIQEQVYTANFDYNLDQKKSSGNDDTFLDEIYKLFWSNNSNDNNRKEDLLFEASRFGINGSIPYCPEKPENTKETITELYSKNLENQIKAVKTVLKTRIEKAKQIIFQLEGGDSNSIPTSTKKLGLLNEIVDIIFNRTVKIFPKFNLKPAISSEMNLSKDDLNKNITIADIEDWTQKTAYVRPNIAQYQKLKMFTKIFNNNNGNENQQFDIFQLPFQEGDEWMGREFSRDDEKVWDGRVSILNLGHSLETDPRREITGLFIDQWIETIPNKTEDTAVTFHYNQPNQEAPQCLLLAVSPKNKDENWSLDDLSEAVNDAFRLARIRALDYYDLKGAGQFLPFLYFAFNEKKHTPSINF